MLIGKLLKKNDSVTDIGIEIECEGYNLPKDIPPFWDVHHDGSLRGNQTAEYVTYSGLKFNSVKDSLKILCSEFLLNETWLYKSDRTSVHVHVNVLDMEYKKFWNFFFLYMIFEELLMNLCGEDRKGNLFCLRNEDAEGLLFALEPIITQGDINKIKYIEYKYAALNFSAINKYGSLEFRGMRGTGDFNLIYKWVDILWNMKQVANEYENPQQILYDFSGWGVENIYNKVFKYDIKYPSWKEDCLRCLRNVQLYMLNFKDITIVDINILEPLEDI